MRQDLDLLQGSWSVTALNVEGQKMSAGMLANAQIAIEGNRFTSTGMGSVYKGTLELDTSKSPQHLTMKFDAGPEKGNTNRGIYKLDGDTLKICLATRGIVRPSRFAAPAGSGFALETLTRGSAPAAAKTKAGASKKAVPAKSSSAPAAVTEFEGEWRLVSGVMDGHAMEESLVKWVKRVTEGNQTTVYAGPQLMLKVEFSSDASQSPKAIDYFGLAGSTKGKAQAGIYEFAGDLLKFCVAPPGAARPTQFQSAPGDGRTLTVWKRAPTVS
jgi:uncharacterized protein (TIGR03067 family)